MCFSRDYDLTEKIGGLRICVLTFLELGDDLAEGRGGGVWTETRGESSVVEFDCSGWFFCLSLWQWRGGDMTLCTNDE